MASTVRYYFDPATAHYIRVEIGLGTRILRAFKWITITTLVAGVMAVGYTSFFELPREAERKLELLKLGEDYKKLDVAVTSLHQTMAIIEKRDDQLYRSVLGTDPIDHAVREGGIGGAERYQEFRDKNIPYGELQISLYTKIEKLRRKLYIESVSQEELLQKADEKQKLFAATPAIQPLYNKQLTALASGFGMRMHPVYKVIRMHTGIDFASPVGTPVYATADGDVVAIDTAVQGYGKIVILDHGFGYQTRYAHVQDFKVKLGDHVKRGVLIALSGNSGVSTAPHLHYEVILNGIQINPINYFFNDLSPMDYEKIVELASIPNQSLGN